MNIRSIPQFVWALLLLAGWNGVFAQTNQPPDGIGHFTFNLGLNFSPSMSNATTTFEGADVDASKNGEFATSSAGTYWFKRYIPITPPGVRPRNEVDVYQKDGSGNWVYQTTLEPPTNAGNNSSFGVSIVAQGSRIFIGAPGTLNTSNVTSGVVYVYELDGNTLSLVQTIEPPAGVAGDGFGFALAVDGDNLVVGAPGRDRTDGTTIADAGAVFLYEYGSSWTLLRTEWGHTAQANVKFGYSVALKGRILAVGAPYEDFTFHISGTDYPLADCGSVYLGLLSHAQQLVRYPNLYWLYPQVQPQVEGLAGSHFGWSVAVHDAMRIAVGMPDHSWLPEDNMSGWEAGMVMIMHWHGLLDSGAQLIANEFSRPELSPGDRFGEYIEVAGGGMDFAVQTALRTDNAPVHYYVQEPLLVQPGTVVNEVEQLWTVGDLFAMDPDGDPLTHQAPVVLGVPGAPHFELTGPATFAAKASLAQVVNGLHTIRFEVSDGNGGTFAETMTMQLSGAAADIDSDGLPDDWEQQHFGGLEQNPDGDYDGDGLTNLEEYQGETDPVDPEGPLLPGRYLDFNLAQSVPGQDFPATGPVTVLDDGKGVSMTGNRWLRIPHAYTVTADTVLEFEFKGTVQGEVHAVGLDEDGNPTNTPRLCKVWGTDGWTFGPNAGDDYDRYQHHSPEWATYRIRIGKYYTGAMQYLVVANDHDLGAQNASSEIRHVKVYEAPVRDAEDYINLAIWSGYGLTGGGDRPKEGVVSAFNDGRELELTGNRWVKVWVDHDVQPFTVLDFSYRGDIQGEIHALGLDENTTMDDAPRLFQLQGPQRWEQGIGVVPLYEETGQWVDYRLEVGKYYTGLMKYLAFASDHDVPNANASSRFRDVRIVDEADSDNDGMPNWWEVQYGLNPALNDAELDPDGDGLTNYLEYLGNTNPMDPEGPLLLGGYLDFNTALPVPGQDFPETGSAIVGDEGRGISLTGNRWLRIPYDYEVTPDTVIEFEFKGTQQGEIHAVGLDEDSHPTNAPRLFKVWGAHAWTFGPNPGDYDHYRHHTPDWTTYRIRAGKYYTGLMHYVTVANDHDAGAQNAASEVRNIRIYEAPVVDEEGYVNLSVWGGYGIDAGDGDQPKKGVVSSAQEGRELQLTGNRWVQVRMDYEVKSNTFIEFAFKSDAQGEIHALGLDENSIVADAPRLFQVYGTQYWANAQTLEPGERYNTPGEWKTYQLAVGRSYTGMMKYLAISNDHDVSNPSASTTIKDVRIFERLPDSDNDGIPDQWEIDHGFDPYVANDWSEDTDGDGLSNLAEYVNGSDPNDYYNGTAPAIFVKSGGGQFGPPDSVLPEPVVFEVNSGAVNAPLTITANGGAQISEDGATNWVTSLTLRTTDLSGVAAARVYIKLPDEPSKRSEIAAQATTGTQTVTKKTYATTFDAMLLPPTQLGTSVISKTSVMLTWRVSDHTKHTSIEISLDNGATWDLWGVVDPGVEFVEVDELETGKPVKFRVITGDLRPLSSQNFQRKSGPAKHGLLQAAIGILYGKSMHVQTGPSPVSPPSSPAESTPEDVQDQRVVFTSTRTKSLRYNASEQTGLLMPPVGSSSYYFSQYVWTEPLGFSPLHDGFNGDADVDNVLLDPGDPRDLIPNVSVQFSDYDVVPGAIENTRYHYAYWDDHNVTPPVVIIGNYLATNAYTDYYQTMSAYQSMSNRRHQTVGTLNYDHAQGQSVLDSLPYYNEVFNDINSGWKGAGNTGLQATTSSAILSKVFVPNEGSESVGIGKDAYFLTYSADPEEHPEFEQCNGFFSANQVRLQTNVEVAQDENPLAAKFLLTRITSALDVDPNQGTIEALASIKLSIMSGLYSTASEVEGTLPSGVMAGNGVITLGAPPPTLGSRIEYSLLPVELRSEEAINDRLYDLSKHDETIYPRPGRVKAADETKSLENALCLYFEDSADDDQIIARSDTQFDLRVANGTPLYITGLKWETLEKPPGSPDLIPSNDPNRLIKIISNHEGSMRGGLYRYELAGTTIEGQVWLPLAGPDISTYWQSEIDYFRNTWGPSYRAKLHNRTWYLVSSPAKREALKQAFALKDMQTIGGTLDWSGDPQESYSPCGGPNKSGDEYRLTIHGVVIDFRKRNNMMYALIGRQMSIPAAILTAAGDPTTNPFATGAPDTDATKESYQAGYDLHSGTSLQDVMRNRGRKMQEPNNWSRREWPSWEQTTKGLTRVQDAKLQELIQ